MFVSDIEEHYVKNRKQLVGIMGRHAGSPEAGEDVVQEAYYRALRYQRTFDGVDLNAWIWKLAKNCLRDYQAKERGHYAEELDEEMIEEDNGHHKHLTLDIYKSIRRKNPEHREILMMYYRYGYGAKNISEITGYPYAKCHQVIQRFKNELKEVYS